MKHKLPLILVAAAFLASSCSHKNTAENVSITLSPESGTTYKAGQPVVVAAEVRRQLPQKWSELLVQRQHTRSKEVCERRFHVIELFHVSYEPWTFYRKGKLLGRGIAPSSKAFRPLERVECPVDLDARELLGGEG